MANLFKDTAAQDDDGKPSEPVARWLREISDARKREEVYRKDAERVVNIYEMERSQQEPNAQAFNILYANTETISPAVYNSTPRPVVKRRFKDDNPPGKVASKVMQRTLEFLRDSNDDDFTPFDDLMKNAVLEALLPGRGVTRFRYDAETVKAPAEDPSQEPSESVESETVCGEEVPWNRIYFGYAKRWTQVPWICFEHFMTREECVENFGEEKGNAIKLTAVPSDSGDREDKLPANAQGVKFAHIYEIWDKTTRTVRFISEGAKESLKDIPDPLKLSGFYPIPRPLAFTGKVKSLIPVPLYLMYEQQAIELNKVSTRIIRLTDALKVRGFYDGTLQGLDRLLASPDNTLLPASNTAAMQQGQSLESSIWLMPLDKIVSTLQQLYINRQQIMSVIYQITGVADIMRGASQASETLGAQKMKEAWGTMRLKRMQKEVQRYVRDCMRIMAELAAENFDQKTFASMTGVQLLTDVQKAELQAHLQALQQQAAMQAQAQPQQPGMPPQVPQQAPIPPGMQEALGQPTWEEILALFKNNMRRNYNIDIETNSTVDAEATEDQAQVAEFMNALSQLLNGLGPLVEKGFMSFDVAKTLLLAVTKRFQFGEEVEDSLKTMQAPPPPSNTDPKAAAEAEKMKAQMAHEQGMNQIAQQAAMSSLELQKAKDAAESQRLQQRMQLEAAKFNADMTKLGYAVKAAELGGQVAEVEANAAVRVATARVKTAEASPPPSPSGA